MRTDPAKFKIWFERALPREYAGLLEGVGEAVGPASATPEEPLSALPGSHAIIASARIRYDGRLMDQAPTLRVISRTGIGIDNIDVQAATARGIAVCNAPDAPTISTVEHAITLILALAKQIRPFQRMLEQGGKHDYFNLYTGLEVNGACLGLVGFGRIGTRVARIALELGMQVSVYDPFVSKETIAIQGVSPVTSLLSLLRSADIVSLHLPLIPETRHLIDAAALAEMKPGALLVNTSRGGLVDETALLAALQQKHLGGAGLDVFDSEPPPCEHPLLHRDDVIATPHIAGATLASKKRLWEQAIAQAFQVLRGERPPNLVNPKVWES